jgi:uncharacterized phage protein (TIGR02218 family)
MMTGADALHTHLKTGITTVCHAWAVTRRDGQVYGFTDHDLPLQFDGIDFSADTGMTALALQQTTGLAVDNTEAIGALSDAALTEEDIKSGRFDGAEVKAWKVNWADVDARKLIFCGTIGEVRRANGAFTAELRGLTEVLNQPQGRVYQKPCTAVLGDMACGFDLNTLGYATVADIQDVDQNRLFRFPALQGFEDAWFERGMLRVLTGTGEGLYAPIKRDVIEGDTRLIELWEPIAAILNPGDEVRLEAGCDKRHDTCRLKFNNLLNFQGFPHIPGDDWLMTYPTKSGHNDGGSLQ